MASTKKKIFRREQISPDGCQVVPPAGHVADPADGDDPRPLVAGPFDRRRVDPFDVGRNLPRLDAASREIQPRVQVRREFARQRDDVVAGLPGKAFGDEVDPFRCVVNDGDFVGRRTDQLRTKLPRRLDGGPPARPVGDAVGHVVAGKFDQHVRRRPRSAGRRPRGRSRPTSQRRASGPESHPTSYVLSS